VIYDIVIIGAGHNGLTAGCYLADAGQSVLILEATELPGGMSASGTPIIAAPQHVVNYRAVDLPFWSTSPVSAELGLDRHGLRCLPIDPAYAYLHPDGESIAFWRDASRTAAEIRRFSPTDAAAFVELSQFVAAFGSIAFPMMATNPLRPDRRALAGLVGGAGRNVRRLKAITAFAVASADEYVDERFAHPVTRAALQNLAATLGPSDVPGTALGLLALALVHGKTVLRPVGGFQSVPNALLSRFQSAGGTVRASSSVAQISVRNGRANGVTLVDGTFIAATAVLSTCDPRTTLERLVPPGTLTPRLESRVRHIPANAAGVGQMKVDLALSGRLRLSRHQARRADDLDLRIPCCFIGTPDRTRRSFSLSAAGFLAEPEDTGVWSTVPTAIDATQAPPGQDTLYLYCPAMPLAPEKGWPGLADAAAAAIVAQASEYYDGIEELEIGRWTETPQEMEQRTGATNGCWSHIDWNIFRLGPFRPAVGLGGYRTPVDGLFHGGAGSHPGPGVTGLPGRNAAKVMLRTLPTGSRR
jgi:phytoene dehydrogenase-like protein